eukprot:m51a1_g11775 hypothetical protein (239) ;mRNA; f:273584-276783
MLVSWRLLSTDSSGIGFNVYRGAQRLNPTLSVETGGDDDDDLMDLLESRTPTKMPVAAGKTQIGTPLAKTTVVPTPSPSVGSAGTQSPAQSADSGFGDYSPSSGGAGGGIGRPFSRGGMGSQWYKWLNLDPDKAADKEFLHLAERGSNSDLPPGWEERNGKFPVMLPQHLSQPQPLSLHQLPLPLLRQPQPQPLYPRLWFTPRPLPLPPHPLPRRPRQPPYLCLWQLQPQFLSHNLSR